MTCRSCPAKIPVMRLDSNVKRAICLRLKHFLEAEETFYAHWKDNIRPRLKKTLADTVERKMKQRIQAYRIVIWILTDSNKRTDEFPGYWKN